MFLVIGIEVLSSLLYLLIVCEFVSKSKNTVLDIDKVAFVVVVFEDQIKIVDFGYMLIELHVVSDNLLVILHLDTLDCLFHISYKVDVTIIFSE